MISFNEYKYLMDIIWPVNHNNAMRAIVSLILY